MDVKKKQIAILGSTGSIGVQALGVISEHSDLFEVEVLTANNNSALLIEQSKKFKPNTVVITNEDKYKEVDDALFNLGIKVFAGQQSLEEVVEGENIDILNYINSPANIQKENTFINQSTGNKLDKTTVNE